MNAHEQLAYFGQRLEEISGLVDTVSSANSNAEIARTRLEELRHKMKQFAANSKDSDAVQAVKGALGYLPKLSSRPGPLWSSKICGAQIDLSHYLR
jgi:demethoxyubiquinone hydroxylase (CLK1/Coq7/Cat5 family)